MLDLDDGYCTGINSYIWGVTMCVVISYIYGLKRFEEDVTLMTGPYIPK